MADSLRVCLKAFSAPFTVHCTSSSGLSLCGGRFKLKFCTREMVTTKLDCTDNVMYCWNHSGCPYPFRTKQLVSHVFISSQNKIVIQISRHSMQDATMGKTKTGSHLLLAISKLYRASPHKNAHGYSLT